MEPFDYIYGERAGEFELCILSGVSFPMDHAAVTEHENEHMFTCMSDWLLLLLSLNSYLDLCIFSLHYT